MIDRAESTPFIGASYTHRLRRAAFVSAIVLVMAIAGCGSGNSSKTTTGSSTASVTTAEPATASGPPTVVASGISFPSNLTFDPQGRLWVAAGALGPTPQEGIWYVPTGGTPQHVAGGLTSANGLVWVGNRLYVGSTTSPGIGQINVLEGFKGKAFGHRSVLIKDLQIGGHTLGTLALGPEGRLYVGFGAIKDHSGAPGTVVSFPPSGGGTQVEATGLRTAFGLAFWGPQLIVTDNGPDEVGPAPDQLLAFDPAGPVADFGFPACYGQAGTACNGAKPPLALFPAHSAPAASSSP